MRKNLTAQCNLREFGANSGKLAFSRSERCCISNSLLPNKCTKMDKCSSKVFVSQYTKDGTKLIVASQDQKIRIYDTSRFKYKLMNTILARDVGWSVLDVAVSPDGRHIIYSSWSDKIHQCNVSGESESHLAFHMNPSESRFCCFSMRFSADGCEILAGSSDCCLSVYNREVNARTLRVRAHDDDVNAVCFADNSSHILYTGSDDGLVKVWDRRTLNEDKPKPVACFAGHFDGITFVDTKNDARFLISNGKDQNIKLWDIRRPSSESAIRAARSYVGSQSWDYRWQTVSHLKNRTKPVVDGGDSSVMTYKGSHAILHTLIRCFFSPEFTTGQQFIYCGCATGSCVVYDLNTGKMVMRLKGHNACVRDVTWHPFHNEICTSSWDSRVCRWMYQEYNAFDQSADSESEYSSLSSDDDAEIAPVTIPVAQSLTVL